VTDHHGDAARRSVPEVTAVIPTRNRSALLRRALGSVLWQTTADLEVVVVDDGSTDATPAMLEQIRDRRVRSIRNDSPRGVSAARNAGIREARAGVVAFLDDDDLWGPDKLRLQLDALAKTRRAWVYTGSVNITPACRVVGGSPPPDPEVALARLPESNSIPGGCSGVMVEKPMLLEAGRFDVNLQAMADWDLWMRLAALGPPVSVPRPLVAYQVHAGNMSLNFRRMRAEFAVMARRYPSANAAIFYRYLGWWALRVDRRAAALDYFLRAGLRRDPHYLWPQMRGDLAYLRRRVVPRIVRGRRHGVAPDRSAPGDEELAWRAEAQSWIDDLEGRVVSPP
jgi:glycosyltransferase involved in cell wall biosynthesis